MCFPRNLLAPILWNMEFGEINLLGELDEGVRKRGAEMARGSRSLRAPHFVVGLRSFLFTGYLIQLKCDMWSLVVLATLFGIRTCTLNVLVIFFGTIWHDLVNHN